ncbi:MFS transporter [Nesterenkonia alkaliphila]|nr:MFS transporter [Nesterenkonia alkaliphila]
MLTATGYHAPMSRTTDPGEHALRAADAPSSPDQPLNKWIISAWSLWSWGNATVSAVMVTFVFAPYVVNVVGENSNGTQWLTIANLIAGIIIAATAPVVGQRADRSGKRKLWLTVLTLIVTGLVAACFLVRPEDSWLLVGVTLLATMNLVDTLANVHLNAMITDISDSKRMGRVSGIGWGAGYLGGIFILAIAYFGMVSGEGGMLGLPTENSFNIRMVAVAAAAWFLIFALPLLLTPVKTADQDQIGERISIWESYKRLWRTVVGLWRNDRNTFWFFVSSAVYRDGLSGVFAYGAILGTSVYGISPGDILLFGIAGNVIAAAGAILGGWIDDWVGPRNVIRFSVGALVVSGVVLFFMDVEREIFGITLTPTTSFWVFGLALCLFVGPAQAASRGFLGRIAPPDRASELFGLYQTAGRSVDFMTSGLIAVLLWIALGDPDVENADKAIIVAVVLILALGLALFSKVKAPQGYAKLPDHHLT